MLTVCASLGADTVFLKGGERFIGKVVAEDPAKIIFESQTVGKIEIPRERIERIERDAPSPAREPNRPFVPPAPVVITNPPASTATTNAPAKRRLWELLPPPQKDEGVDWIQLKSGEWLRGKLHGMENRSLEFDSDELGELTFDWKDVAQVISPRAQVSYGNRQAASGALQVDRQRVTVSGPDGVRLPREDLIGISPGERRELDYWSGKFDLGLNLASGNTEQANLFAKLKIERRTPITHLKLEDTANFGETEGIESVNNNHATLGFDILLSRRLFIRTPLAEYYRDPFQNIAHRITLGAGLGYYLIDNPRTEWLVLGGPAYQRTSFNTVETGQPTRSSTPALVLGSHFKMELTKRVDFELDYQALVVSEQAGRLIQHAEAVFEIKLTRRLDLDVSITWDSTKNPQPDAAGVVPKQSDVRLNLSLGVKF